MQADLHERLQKRLQDDREIRALRTGIAALLQLKEPVSVEIPDTDRFLEPLSKDPFHVRTIEEVMNERLEQMVHPNSLLPPPKLTDACRTILRSMTRPVSAPEVRQELEILGFDFSRYVSNPLSSIHTVLKRLAQSGEACASSDQDGRPTYQWKGQLPKGD